MGSRYLNPYYRLDLLSVFQVLQVSYSIPLYAVLPLPLYAICFVSSYAVFPVLFVVLLVIFYFP
jgi:hypothetical protein